MNRFTCLLAAAVTLAAAFPAHDVSAAESEKAVTSPFGGNGHNVSFDGRLMIVRTGPGWVARLLRPERITLDGSGFPNVSDAFTAPTLIQTPTSNENALAICEADAASTPYRCNAAGDAAGGGAFACYDLFIIDSDAVAPAGSNPLRRRRLFLQVRNPETRDAVIERFEWRGAIETLSTRLNGIEPTVTRDGRLMVWQGQRENDGRIDTIVYSYNDTPCGRDGWSAPRDLSEMYTDARLTGTYRLADSRLRAPDGTFYSGEVRGAYPWLFQDGEALTMTATNMPCRAPDDPAGCGPRRNALSVIGYPTNWALAHIDGDVNPSTEDEVRLFFSSPGPRTFTTIPATEGLDVWPFFGSNTSNYTEIAFDDGLDGRYAGVWHMNESISTDGNFDRSRTPDTSGFFNTGQLRSGAFFPARNNGANGKAIVLNGTGARIEVPHAASLNPVNQLTVELSIRPDSPVDCDGGNNYRYLLGKGPFDTGAYSLVIEDDMSFQARVRAGGAERAIRSLATVPVGSYSHIAFTYDAASGEMSFFVDGVETNTVTHPPGTLDGSTDILRIGAWSDTPACPPTGHGGFHGAVDEVKISNVVRYGDVPPVTPPPDAGTPPPPGTDAGPPPAGTDAGTPPPGTDGSTPPPGGDAATPPPGVDPPDGGEVSGGCTAAPGRGHATGLAALVLVCLGLWRRRRR